MALIGHVDVLAPQSLSGDSPSTARTKINNNFTLGKTESQKIEERIEHSFSSLHGEGLLTVPTATYSADSLQVTFGAFTCLLGVYIAYAGGQATLLANQTGASLYFCQDGTFATTLPTTKTYFAIGTYTTDGTGCTAFTVAGKLLLPILTTISGTVAGIYVPDDTDIADGYVDHSATATIAVDGVLKLTVTPSSAFYVEELYPGGVLDADSGTQYSPPRQRTNEGFHYRVTRRAGYAYSSYPTCTLTYSRTGLVLAS